MNELTIIQPIAELDPKHQKMVEVVGISRPETLLIN